MSQTVTALYQDRASASAAIDKLVGLDVPKRDISILMSDTTKNKEFGVEVNTKAPEGTAIGGTTGGAIGAIAAGLASIGTIGVTGGIGLAAAGPVLGTLAGAGAGAAVGGLTGALVGLGFDENEAKLVEKDLENGSMLIAVEVTEDRKATVKKSLEDTNAKKVSVY